MKLIEKIRDALGEDEMCKSIRNYRANQPIYIDGSLSGGVYCLLSGKAKIFKLGTEGKEQILNFVSAGDVIGHHALFANGQHLASATSIERSQICFIEKAIFLKLIESDFSFRMEFVKDLTLELSSRSNIITEIAQKSVRERLASSLVYLMSVYKNEPINLSRDDIANFVGATIETVSRVLGDFVDEKIIERKGRNIFVLNESELKRISGI